MPMIEDKIAEIMEEVMEGTRTAAILKAINESELWTNRKKRAIQSILALISSVPCRDCGGLGYFARHDGAMGCKPCKGTGYRKVMVRYETGKSRPRTPIMATIPLHEITSEIVAEGRATLVLEVEG